MIHPEEEEWRKISKGTSRTPMHKNPERLLRIRNHWGPSLRVIHCGAEHHPNPSARPLLLTEIQMKRRGWKMVQAKQCSWRSRNPTAKQSHQKKTAICGSDACFNKNSIESEVDVFFSFIWAEKDFHESNSVFSAKIHAMWVHFGTHGKFCVSCEERRCVPLPAMKTSPCLLLAV